MHFPKKQPQSESGGTLLVLSSAVVLVSALYLVGPFVPKPDMSFVAYRSQVLQGNTQLAQVGASASIRSNEYNQLAQELSEKEQELSAREESVVIREREVQTQFVERRDQTALIYTTLIGLLLLALILLNFLMDIKRKSEV